MLWKYREKGAFDTETFQNRRQAPLIGPKPANVSWSSHRGDDSFRFAFHDARLTLSINIELQLRLNVKSRIEDTNQPVQEADEKRPLFQPARSLTPLVDLGVPSLPLRRS